MYNSRRLSEIHNKNKVKTQLTAPRRPVEEHPARRLHPKLEELVRMLHRILDQLLELALHVLQSTDVGPRHVGHLHDGLA